MRVLRGSLLILPVLLVASVMGSCSSNKSSPMSPPAAKELNSGNVGGSGGVYQHTFTVVGTYPYHCSIHPSMTGSVVVDNAGAAAVGVAFPPGTSNPFPAAHVQVNGTVTWTNNTGITHTVTSD